MKPKIKLFLAARLPVNLFLMTIALIGLCVLGISFRVKKSAPLTSHNKVVRAVLPDFAHIVVIVEENHGFSSIIGNPNASYINMLADQYSLATNYFANARPSLLDYLIITSGTTGKISANCKPGSSCQINDASIADEIEKSGRTWKGYFEGMPKNCATENSGRYNVYHNPFVYYKNIVNDASRCNSHVVPLGQLDSDLSNNSLPNYVFIVPDRCNDMHDCPVATGDQWLATQVTKMLNSPAFTKQNSLLLIVWDESETNGAINNKIPLILAGPSVKKNYKSSIEYDHYSLLHSVESAWSLPALSKDHANAPIFDEFFER